MNYLKFKNPNTGDESYVNLDSLDNVKINAEKKNVSVCLDHGVVLEANLDEFEKAFGQGKYKDEMLAYLERQKEQKPVKLNDDTEVGLDRALEIVKAAKGNLCGYQSDDGIYECCHAIQTLERILKNGIEQQKEQKPIPKFKVGDRIYDKRDSYNRNVIREVGKDYYINAFAQKMDMAYTNANFEFIEHLDNETPASKPAEWSEEDEACFELILRELEQDKEDSQGYSRHFTRLIDWFTNRLKFLCPQPKDNKCISPKEGDIVVNKYGEISVFENWGHHPDGGSFNDKSYFFAKCTLKGDCYNDYDCHPDSVGLRYATPEEIRKIVPYLLESIQPHWKPSEEQMAALDNARFCKSYDQSELDLLYEQLKRLL